MKQKRQPLRKCCGCGEMKEKRELVRIVRAPLPRGDDAQNAAPEISLDLTGKMPGRGVYVCKNPACIEKARKARRPERSLGCKIPDEIYDELGRQSSAPNG